MTTKTKTTPIEAVEAAVGPAMAADRQSTLTVLADAERALKRIVRRAEVPAGMERFEIVQNRGPRIEFTGKLLCSELFETRATRDREALEIEMEVYRTEGGALIAASHTNPAGREGREFSSATVVPPGDEMEMRLAVMAHFEWADRARSMVRKALGWDFRVEVA